MPRQQLKPTVRQQAPTASAAVPPQTNSPFSQSEIQELTNSFHLFDVHGTGSVKASELRSVLEMLQQEEGNSSNSSSSSRINTLIEKLSYIGDDENEDEMLTLEDYLDLMASTTVTGSTNDQETIPAIFDLFDSDGKGYISIDDLHRVSVELGEQMTQEELQEMIRRAKMKESDTDTHQQRGGRMQQHQQDDRVTLEEFQRILQTNFSIPLRDQRSDNAWSQYTETNSIIVQFQIDNHRARTVRRKGAICQSIYCDIEILICPL